MGAIKNLISGAAELLGIEPPTTERSPDVAVEETPIDRARRVEALARADATRASTTCEAARSELAAAERAFTSTSPTDADAWHHARAERDRLTAVLADLEPVSQGAAQVLQIATARREALEREAYVSEQAELGAVDKLDRSIAADIAAVIEHEQAIADARARLQERMARANQHRSEAGLPPVNSGRAEALSILARAGTVTEPIAMLVRTALGAYNHPGRRIPIDPAEYVARVMSADSCGVVDDEIDAAAREAAKSPLERQQDAERAEQSRKNNENALRVRERLERREHGTLNLDDMKVDGPMPRLIGIDQIAGSTPHRKVQLPNGVHGYVPGNFKVQSGQG